VADVADKLSVAGQIRLIAELRWRILRNHLRRKNSKLDLIGLIWAAIFSGIMVFGLSFTFCWGAYISISTGHFGWLGLLFWSIFLFWQTFPLFVAGFGAPFEFRTLLRFPLSLTAFYLVGLAYGLADFAAIASSFWLLAVAVGVGIANLSLLLPVLLILVLFVLMSTTIERLLGSWLERLLARRRTRELFFGLFILLSVCLQFIRPLITRYAAVDLVSGTASLSATVAYKQNGGKRALSAKGPFELDNVRLNEAGTDAPQSLRSCPRGGAPAFDNGGSWRIPTSS